MRYSSNPFDITFFRNHRTIPRLAALAGLIFALSICWNAGIKYEAGKNQENYQIPENTSEVELSFPYLSVTELDKITEMKDAAEINLSEYDDLVEITAGGDYRLFGDLDGSIHITAIEQNVHLFLDGVNVKAKSGPAIYCEDLDKLNITLLPDTENIISDSGHYYSDELITACIYSDSDITFNGSGSLAVNSYYKDAIRSKDIVKILDGNYELKCKRNAVHGNDGLLIGGGKLMISSEKNALKTTKAGAGGRGNLVVTGGELSIIAGRFAFVSEKADLILNGCTVYNNSVLGTYDVGGLVYIQEGCVQ